MLIRGWKKKVSAKEMEKEQRWGRTEVWAMLDPTGTLKRSPGRSEPLDKWKRVGNLAPLCLNHPDTCLGGECYAMLFWEKSFSIMVRLETKKQCWIRKEPKLKGQQQGLRVQLRAEHFPRIPQALGSVLESTTFLIHKSITDWLGMYSQQVWWGENLSLSLPLTLSCALSLWLGFELMGISFYWRASLKKNLP
jgi:hypothetical protein